jgi:hypothetical protein
MPSSQVTARREKGAHRAWAPRLRIFVDADDFEVVPDTDRAPALEYGGPKTMVYSWCASEKEPGGRRGIVRAEPGFSAVLRSFSANWGLP